MNNKALLFCRDCQDKRWFIVEGNYKLCEICGNKSSYKEVSRKRWVYAKSHPDTVSLSPYNTEADESVKEKFEEIQSRLYLLSPREREVVELLWEGKTQEEVAAILKVTRQRVTTCLQRARKKLVVA